MTYVAASSDKFSAACGRIRQSILRWAVAICALLHISWICGVVCAENPDSATLLLPDLEVKAEGRSNLVRNGEGDVKVRTKESLRLTRSFGEADLLGSIRTLAGVERGSDYGSGISIDGLDPSHTQYLVDGVPVIFPFRFGGIFTTFNTPHFSGLTFSRHSQAGLYPRLGGAVELESSLRGKPGVEGIVNVGIISSSATLRGALSENVWLTLSGRISYIDQIYGRLLKSEKNTLGFSFSDYNATLGWRPGSRDLLKVSFLRSADRVSYDDRSYLMSTRLRWHNTAGGMDWSHTGDLCLNASAWISEFADILTLDMGGMSLDAPASFVTGGCRFVISASPSRGRITHWDAGVRMDIGRAVPQHALLEMAGLYGGDGTRASLRMPQDMQTWLGFGSMRISLIPERLRLDLSLSAGVFRSRRCIREGRLGSLGDLGSLRKDGDCWWSALLLSPRLRLTWRSPGIGEVVASMGRYVQPLHQIGFSELGLASDFTVGATEEAPVQESWTLNASWRRRLPWARMYVRAEGFWSKVGNQTEYRGQVLEVVDENYDPFDHLVVADGHNIGGSLAIGREMGNVTGELSYGFATGRRHLPGESGSSWRALHAAGHTLKVNIAWQPAEHWTVSAGYAFASGRPYTPVKDLYIISGNIAMSYAERNSARLPAYSRLDIGATYAFRTVSSKLRLRHLVNLSLLNALGHRNVEMQYFTLDIDKDSYGMKRLYSLYRFIPSLSYTLEF